ncbi:MAG: DUF6142 family protein [Lachnospiraceae bacterium]|nr:DUF6142 family protein [Lachnospiraceae bacterium]
MRKKNRRTNKFTNKKHSVKGLMACILDGISLITLIMVFAMAFNSSGNVGSYLGMTGIASLILSMMGLIFAIQGFREETTFNTMPGVGIGLSVFTILCWGGMLVLGGAIVLGY